MKVSASGPVPAPILLVGEAPGKEEAMSGRPFVGASGRELRRMLKTAGIDERSVRFTNVFSEQPPSNDIKSFCAKREVVGKSYDLPPLSPGNYVKPEHLLELARLRKEVEETSPSLIIAVGNTPCWALLKRTGISKLRGNLFPLELDGLTGMVLPTYHPAAVLRDWSLRVVAITDFIKARRFLAGDIKRKRRELWLNPTIEECEEFIRRYTIGPEVVGQPELLTFDVETAGKTVTCISFAPDDSRAICIPFFDPTAPDKNYWPTPELEKRAYSLVKSVLESPLPKLGQNGLYDIQYCHRWGIQVQNYLHDTMIRHHSIYPELEKGLGFLGSVYTDEAPWKLLRARNKDSFKLGDD